MASVLHRAAATFPAILVTGARQTGKTTLLRNEFEASHRYVSLEAPHVRLRAAEDPVGFLRENPPPLILDEIQYAPDLLPYIKDQIDQDRTPGRWLLTGSQTFGLMKGVSQTLAGRVAVLELLPLSTAETAKVPGPASMDALIRKVFGDSQPTGAGPPIDLGDWLLRGGYPEPRLNPLVDRSLWFGSYVQTYLERDVRDLAHVGDLGTFTRFLTLVAARTGTIVNLAELGAEAGVTGPTARRWLSVLEASGIVCLLQPFHRSFGRRIRKSPKLYMLDPGLATYLMGLHTPEAALQSAFAGPLVETSVLSEWIKAFRHRGERPGLFYWRSGSGLEVDLIIEWGGHLYAVEVKATATPVPNHANALSRWLRLAGGSARGVIACNIERPCTLRPGIRAVPWHLAW
ncbi:MAG: ATP-binding protein [Deltaproteobacteria bacterium]|nr:ATP-binding protein [Deltaproteobacteria bacterium]